MNHIPWWILLLVIGVTAAALITLFVHHHTLSVRYPQNMWAAERLSAVLSMIAFVGVNAAFCMGFYNLCEAYIRGEPGLIQLLPGIITALPLIGVLALLCYRVIQSPRR